jgi:thiamine pyrophosphokinase
MTDNGKGSAIIVGACPLKDSSFLKALPKDVFKAACDGGYYAFRNLGLEPDILVGDFDTLSEDDVRYPKKIFRLNPMKDDTDVLWTVKYLVQEGYRKICLFGCLGNKISHTIANIQVLSYLCDQGVDGRLYSQDGQTVLLMLKESSLSFRKEAVGKISVFSYEKEASGIDEINLKYPLSDATMNSSYPLGVSNEFIGQPATIVVRKGKLLLVLPSDSLL